LSISGTGARRAARGSRGTAAPAGW
jgi:hypothetical protein